MARNIAEIVKEMRNSPPRKADDPRFDELDQLAADMGGEEMSPEDTLPMDGEMPMDEEAPVELSPEEQDAAMMDEAMGGPDGAPASPEGLPMDESTPEEDMLANSGAPAGGPPKTRRPSARMNPLMKKKKSSYLADL